MSCLHWWVEPMVCFFSRTSSGEHCKLEAQNVHVCRAQSFLQFPERRDLSLCVKIRRGGSNINREMELHNSSFGGGVWSQCWLYQLHMAGVVAWNRCTSLFPIYMGWQSLYIIRFECRFCKLKWSCGGWSHLGRSYRYCVAFDRYCIAMIQVSPGGSCNIWSFFFPVQFTMLLK